MKAYGKALIGGNARHGARLTPNSKQVPVSEEGLTL